MGGSRRSPPADEAARAIDPAARDCAAGGLPSDLTAAVLASLAAALPHGGRAAVALSGGRDSVALLDAALAGAANARCDIVALHVDHGLSADARRWSQFCGELCAARGVEFGTRSVHVERGPRVSPEAAARTARYAALRELAREHAAAAVLLAHHADDQAETTLLQLFRGAGPRGLAAMPRARFDRGLWWLRPFLAIPRARLDDYAAQRGLRYVDDDSNADARFRRNALRNVVVPPLRIIAPGYPATLVRAAELQAEAATLLDDLARIDAGPGHDGTTLEVRILATLDARRARNLLRWFLREQRLPAPSSARAAEMVRQLTCAPGDARVAIVHAGTRLGVHRGRMMIHRRAEDPFVREWDGAETIVLPHGTLRFTRTHGHGIGARHLAAADVTIRSGENGERLRLAGSSARRHVTDLLREAGIPRWDRRALPRIYCDRSLAAVAPHFIDAAFAAAPDEPAFAVDWHPAPVS
jgi:tRNA(Ile)-lysidine synthase